MRYLLLVLFVGLALTTCQKADAVDTMLRAVFDYNQPEDKVEHYSLFVYEAADTLSSPFVQGDNMNPEIFDAYFRQHADEDSLKILYPDAQGKIVFSVNANGEWVQVALTASNSFAQSALAVSGWFKKDLMIVPAQPSGLRIEKE